MLRRLATRHSREFSEAGGWRDIDRIDALGSRDTPMRRINARAKILVLVAFCIAVVSFPAHSVSALTPYAVFPLAVASIGQVSYRFLLRRLLFAAPFLLAIGVANPWFDRRPVLEIAGVMVTGGWISAASLLLRGVLTVSSVLATVACTGMPAFCDGLRRLGVPAILCTQLDLLHRYLFVVGDEARRMQRAASLRMAGVGGCPEMRLAGGSLCAPCGSYREDGLARPQWRARSLRAYAPLLGTLLLRSTDRAGRVHLAMLSRGFSPHEAPTHPSAQPWNTRDAAFVLGWMAFFSVARCENLAVVLGRMLPGGWL